MRIDGWQGVATAVMLLTGGGGIGVAFRWIPEWKKTKAEQQSLTATAADQLVGASAEVVAMIRTQMSGVTDQLIAARVEGAELRDEINSMHKQVQRMQRELDAYHSRYGPIAI